MSAGMPFVVCCHNSVCRLPATLPFLAAQRVNSQTPWEVVLVDNASSDETAEAARQIWGNGPAPLRIVQEPKLGLTWARLAGIHAARYEAVTLVDDDNWLSPDWLTLALDSLRANPLAGAIGGQSHAEPEIHSPAWFRIFAGDFAGGQQAKQTADVTKSRGYLWGAGLVIRREAWTDLLEAGFEFVLDDRAGTHTGSGGDSEICLALRLRGWQLLYDSRLNFGHYLSRERLRWRYLRKLYRGFGQASIVLDTYRLVLRERDDLDLVEEQYRWSFRMRSALKALCRSPVSLGSALLTASEGSPRALAMEYEIGRASALWRLRHELDRVASSIRRLAMRREARFRHLQLLDYDRTFRRSWFWDAGFLKCCRLASTRGCAGGAPNWARSRESDPFFEAGMVPLASASSDRQLYGDSLEETDTVEQRLISQETAVRARTPRRISWGTSWFPSITRRVCEPGSRCPAPSPHSSPDLSDKGKIQMRFEPRAGEFPPGAAAIRASASS